MGLWDTITGRTKPAPANLDALFGVPNAAVTLEAATGLLPTGDGSVCYRAAAGAGFGTAQSDVLELLRSVPDAPTVTVTQDEFGFSWLEVDHRGVDVGGLCTDLHAVNTALESSGFGSALLCSLIPFTAPGGARVGLVYLYKRGTFYPFAPTGGQQRDNLTELQVRDALSGELPLETDLSKWLAIWGAPGL